MFRGPRMSAGSDRLRTHRSLFSRDSRQPFKLIIHNGELAQIQAWVLRHDDIETGGDLFGLWSTNNTAVVLYVLGPGQHCRRTTTSFFQDADYLGDKGRQLTEEYGLCHIGEWHSHHTLGLARPSAGDESTVWQHMPNNGFRRFIVCIANIDRGESSKSNVYPRSSGGEQHVGLGCFLFEVKDNVSWDRYEVLQGSFKVIEGQSHYRESQDLHQRISLGAESINPLHGVNFEEQRSVARGYDLVKTGNNILLYLESRRTFPNYDRTSIDCLSRDLSSLSTFLTPTSYDSVTAGSPNRQNQSSYNSGSGRLTAREHLKSTSKRRLQIPSSTSSTSKRRPTCSSEYKSTSQTRIQPSITTRSSTLRDSASRLEGKRDAVTRAKQSERAAAASLWDKLLPFYQSLLEKLTYELTGQLIKEFDAVTIHFKVGVQRRFDLACRLIYYEEERDQLRLYTSGTATKYSSIKLYENRISAVLGTAMAIKENINNVVLSVVARIPVGNQAITAALPSQEPPHYKTQTTYRSFRYNTPTRMSNVFQ